MNRYLKRERGSSTMEVTLILPSLILLIVSTFDFVWLSLHELSAQFVATETVRDINVNQYQGDASVIARGANFLLDLDASEFEICSNVVVPADFDPTTDLCPVGGQPGKNPGGSQSMVIVRIRPRVRTIVLHAFLGAFNIDFRPEGIAIGRNEPR